MLFCLFICYECNSILFGNEKINILLDDLSMVVFVILLMRHHPYIMQCSDCLDKLTFLMLTVSHDTGLQLTHAHLVYVIHVKIAGLIFFLSETSLALGLRKAWWNNRCVGLGYKCSSSENTNKITICKHIWHFFPTCEVRGFYYCNFALIVF